MNDYKKFFNSCIVIILLCLLTFFICKNQFAKDDINREFTTEDLLEDYDFLWEALETDYLFFDILEEEYGIDVENVRKTTRQIICEQQPDIVGFYRILDSMFMKLNYFAHLNVVSLHGYNIYQKYYNNDDNSSANGWKEILQNKQVQTAYTELLPENIYADADYAYPEIEKSYDSQRKAVVFKICSFDTSLLERDKDFVQDYLKTLEGSPIEHIIFDITGNRGGNDVYWRDYLIAPFDGNWSWSYQLYFKDTELTRKFFFDSLSPKSIHEISQDVQQPEFVAQLGMTHFAEICQEFHGNAELGEEALKAKRWVLIDEYVYSSADSFAVFCKETGWATLVGKRTKGDGIGVEPILVNLPNTGLLVRFSAVTSADSSGRLNTVYGTAPDFVSERYEAPLSTLYRLIDE